MRKGLRVCLDARLAGGTAGGVEQVVIGLASGLSRLDDGREEYFFLTYPDADDWISPYISGPCRRLSAVRHPIATWRADLRSRIPFAHRAWKRFGAVAGEWTVGIPSSDGTIEAAGIDVMHFATQDAFHTNVPSIYHPHDLQHVHLPEFLSPRERLVRDVRYRTFCAQAEMVAVVSSWVQADVRSHYGLPAEKVRVIPWAPVLTEYPTPTDRDLAETRRKFQLPEEFVFYPAQTWAHKNHIGLLEALSIVRERYGIEIPFVGTGAKNGHFASIERRVRELRLGDLVQFLGFVSPLELQCLYRLCRCVAIPSKFEAASFPLWEAFLAGAPAACSNVTSLPRQAGDAALLFDPDRHDQIADAVVRLWTDGELRAVLADRGKHNVARFSWDRTARTFRAHYRRIGGEPLTPEDQALVSEPAPL